MEVRELINMVLSYEEAKAEVIKIDELIVPERPKGLNAYTIKEWNEYNRKKQAYDSAVKQKSSDREALVNAMEKAKSQIIKALPVSNIWFVLEEEEPGLAIGHRSNDWPSSLGDILIKRGYEKEELPKINHQIVN